MTDRSITANVIARELVDAIAKYHQRNGVRPTHIEITETEASVIGPHTAQYYYRGDSGLQLDGVKLIPIKRRIGRVPDPVIEWEEA